MEQDRAPDVLPHHGELARPAVGEPRGGGQPDWPHDDEDGVGDSVRTGREQLSNRSRSHGAATGEPRYQAGQVPRRMELYHPAKDINGQFILASCLSCEMSICRVPLWSTYDNRPLCRFATTPPVRRASINSPNGLKTWDGLRLW